MKDKEIIDLYIKMVPFWAQVCGAGCEVLVHDVTNPENSIVAIENNSTGRAIGDSMTDLARDIQAKGYYKTQDYLANYMGTAKNKEFLSFTYFIKNDGRLIGLMCINRDLAFVQSFANELHVMLQSYNLLAREEVVAKENLENPVTSMLHTLISGAIVETGIHPARMSLHEKVTLVHHLNDQGVLMMKGAVTEIAAQLSISEPTVYRYLNRKE